MNIALLPPYKKEICRKLIHLSSLWMPVALIALGRENALVLFAVLLALLLAGEALMRSALPGGALLARIFGPVLRTHEAGKSGQLTGATWMVSSVIVCLIFFTVPVTVTALCITLVSDTCAALVGMKYGTPVFRGKSLEGTTAFTAAGYLTVMALSFVIPLPHQMAAGFLAVTVAAAVEFFSPMLRVDDNMGITLAAALTLWLAQGMM
jgi:dolichol kinase